jgi:hypothetical protein
MLDLHRDKTLALLLLMAVALSSVGLPVIVVSCSMGKVVLTRGCATSCCKTDDAAMHVTRVPCQAQCSFVERNTSSYLPAKKLDRPTPLQIVMVIPASSPVGTIAGPRACTPTASPPLTHDIPILNSSLLI